MLQNFFMLYYYIHIHNIIHDIDIEIRERGIENFAADT